MNFKAKKVMLLTASMIMLFSLKTLGKKQQIPYHSQWGQDRWLNENIFKNKRSLTFIEIGAYDGKYLSNTLFFEKNLDWTGICIEPLPEIFKDLSKNRSCACLNICISQQDSLVPFFVISKAPNLTVGKPGMLSGRTDIWEYVREPYFGIKEKDTIMVPSQPLSVVLKEHNISHIDYLSIDVEGGELDVLKSINWDKTHIVALTVENNLDKPDTRTFLSSKGYLRINRLGRDDIWLNKNDIHLLSSSQ